MWLREKDMDALDLDVQKGKLLIKHLLQAYKGTDFGAPQDNQQFIDILFNLLIPKKQFACIENINDFTELVQNNFMKIIDIDGTLKPAKVKKRASPKNEHAFEILFVEKVEETRSLLIHSKDKCSLDMEGKELLIFLLEQPESYQKEVDNIQTVSLPQFEYKFNPSKPKAMGMGQDFFPSQRKISSE